MRQRDDSPNQRKGDSDPVLDFKLDLEDDLVKLAWESTQVRSVYRETCVLCCCSPQRWQGINPLVLGVTPGACRALTSPRL